MKFSLYYTLMTLHAYKWSGTLNEYMTIIGKPGRRYVSLVVETDYA